MYAPKRDHKIMTTGDCAREIGVSVHSIVKAINAGRLPAFRVPGSLHRRVRREDFEAMCREMKTGHGV